MVKPEKKTFLLTVNKKIKSSGHMFLLTQSNISSKYVALGKVKARNI